MTLDVRSSAPGEYGALRLVSAEILFSVLAPFTVKLDDLAIGDVVVKAWAEILTAYNAVTTNVLTLGTAGTADKYLAAADVAEATPGASASKGPFAAEVAAGLLNAKYTQTGGAATTGRARLYALISSVPA